MATSQAKLVEKLRNKVVTTAQEIKAILDQGRGIKTDESKLFLFKGMYTELKPLYNSFCDAWDELQELLEETGSTLEKAEATLKQTVRRHYFETCSIYQEYMNPTPIPPSTASTTMANTAMRLSLNESRTVRARLPQINLPHFSGNPLEWPLFRDTNRALIHDEATLSDMEKFLFLVSCISGPARSLISNVSLIEANYQQAWILLSEHYNNNRKLAHTYLKQVLEFKPSPGNLRKVITGVIEAIDSFKQLQIKDPCDFILSYLLLRCLDSDTKIQFEKKFADAEFPSYKNLVDFIKTEWKSMDVHFEELDPQPLNKKNFNREQAYPRFKGSSRKTFFVGDGLKPRANNALSNQTNQRTPNGNCPVCQNPHSLYQCKTFRSASSASKLTLLKNWHGCHNCFSNKHTTEICTSLRRNQNHHSWLHQNHDENASRPPPAQAPRPSTQNVEPGISLGSLSEEEVLLGTALIHIKDSQGTFQAVRAVTDSGSQFSLMTKECANRLGLPIQPSKHSVSGVCQISVPHTQGQLSCTIRSSIASYSLKELSTEVIVVPHITSNLPKSTISPTTQSYYKGFALADPEYWKPGPIDFLLGGDIFIDILTDQPILKVHPQIPRLLPTIFGFIVTGPLYTQSKSEGSTFLVQSRTTLKDIIHRFWEVEEVTPCTTVSEEEELCETHFRDTHSRLCSGRYIVSLPVKPSIQSLRNPHEQAFKRLLGLEAKLTKDPLLKREYHTFMREYMDLGHMKEVPSGTGAYTLPHHAVVKHQDRAIKLRTVFDASCKSSTGSLNDHLFIGPKLQLDIRDILSNFRLHSIVFTADIVKMYRQILLCGSDRKYQHILWRFDPSDAVKEYELCTVTYGESSAPYLAQRTLRQLVEDEGGPYPLASRALLEDIYVDDVVAGASSETEASALQTELIELLGKGCFELSKWASNCQNLLIKINESQRQANVVSLSSKDEPKIKLLGMQWNPNRDIFTYEITIPPFHPTKRAILSSIARIYDPLGFLSPVVFYAKIILQDMWASKYSWDDIGPPQICQKWKQFLSQLSAFWEIKIPRRVTHNDATEYSFLGFSDASERGYSAVLYLLTKTKKESHIHLIAAKTKLAPIKPMTVPRLELSGAMLLSRLFKSFIRLSNRLNISAAHFFTDSTIVLGWLSTPPQKLNAFVAHRVVEILEITDRSQWNHVKSADNPADCSSRGLLPSEFVQNTLWWSGPHWATLPQDQWPKSALTISFLPEIKQTTKAVLTVTQPDKPWLILWMERFSNYTRLLHSMSYARRFTRLIKNQDPAKGLVTLAETKESLKICIRLAQRYHQVDKKQLLTLRAFVDEDGLFRVGGRLQNSTLHYDAKHPIILSAKSHFAKLLVDHYHKSYLHIGPSALQAMLMSRYWIVSGRQLIRQRVFKCLRCYKEKQSPQAPLMGSLPSFRLEEGTVFNT